MTDAQLAIAKSMSERVLQAHVIRMAHALGWLCYHTHDSRRSAEGFPDLTLARGKRVLFAELKAERGRTTEAQDRWLMELPDAYLWRPRDLLSREIERVLE